MKWIARRTVLATLLALLSLSLAACRDQPTAPTPRPNPVTPIDRTGPIQITFLSANIAPGSTVTGCGGSIEGCTTRLRITFRLDPPEAGPVLYARVYLHASNLLACLWGETASFAVQAGVPTTLEIPMDRAADCRTPTTIATMAAVVEGPVQVASRQTWSLHYEFAP